MLDLERLLNVTILTLFFLRYPRGQDKDAVRAGVLALAGKVPSYEDHIEE